MATEETKTPQAQQQELTPAAEAPAADATEPSAAVAPEQDASAPTKPAPAKKPAATKKTAAKRAAPRRATAPKKAVPTEKAEPKTTPEAHASEPAAAPSSHAQQDPSREAAPAAQEPTMNSEIPFFGQAFEAAQSFWQQIVDRQVEALEGAIGQLERLGNDQLDKAQSRLDETNKIAKDTIAWLTELNTTSARRAVEAVRAAAAMFPRRAA